MATVSATCHSQIKGETQVIYILDTDIFTLAELPTSPEYLNFHAHALQLEDEDRLVTTIVTYEEQTRGWLAYAAKSREISHQIQAYRRLKIHLRAYLDFEVLDFDIVAAREFENLQKLKTRIGTCDLKIAAIAITQDAILLFRNLRDFMRIPNLRVEDWTKG
jgi:tRNA(fMet)-specific endonuclease VapC